MKRLALDGLREWLEKMAARADARLTRRSVCAACQDRGVTVETLDGTAHARVCRKCEFGAYVARGLKQDTRPRYLKPDRNRLLHGEKSGERTRAR